MIVVDTCALIFDALQPTRLGAEAKRVLEAADQAGNLWCSDISWWEIAMLISKGRLDPGTDCQTFLQLVQASRNLQVQPITAEIACHSVGLPPTINADPADRLIVATALALDATLVTCDENLIRAGVVATVW